MKVRYRELALADLEQIFLYLDERNPVAARKVIDAIHAAITNVADQPLSGRKNVRSVHSRQNRRAIPLQDFLWRERGRNRDSARTPQHTPSVVRGRLSIHNNARPAALGQRSSR
jgi:plasmid stabilization system protein ParE